MPGMIRFAVLNSLLVVLINQSLVSYSFADPVDRRALVGKATKTDVWIQSGDTRLRGSFYVPEGVTEKVPAVVLVHGSGRTTRDGMFFYLASALELGMAVLAYDKRGVGESEGKYWGVNVSDSDQKIRQLAEDAAAGFDWLSRHPQVDKQRIGYMGGSQAGWIMPLAASMDGRAAFVVIGAGTPLTLGAEVYHENLLINGRNGQSVSVAEADQLMKKYQGDPGFDPVPMLKQLSVPMLWIFGTADEVIPTKPSIEGVEALQASGRSNFHLLVVENMNHNFRDVKTDTLHWLAPMVESWLRSEHILTPGCGSEL